jgi:ATP/ADP translocase/HEAT repeat protein
MALIRARLLDSAARRMGLEPEEIRQLVLMAGLVSVLLCAYTIAKVLRDALFLAQFGALALPYAYLGVALAAVGFVWIEGLVARRFQRVGAARFNQYLAIACSVAAALLFPLAPRLTSALFYLWTGSQAMMLLPHFWGLALDLWDSRRARKLFPLLAGFGLIGGLVGGALAGWSLPLIQRVGLMWTLPLLLAAAHALTRVAEGRRSRQPGPEVVPSTDSPWRIILRSPYILIFVAALTLSVVVGTLVDFQFKYYIARLYPNPHDLTQFLGKFYFALNAVALLFQFGLAGWLLQRIGLGASTGLQPATVLLMASWITFGPGLWVVVAMRSLQGVHAQTLGKSTSEIYYAPIRPAERRRIKPAVDTLVERWSDAAVGILLILALHALHVPIPMIAILTTVLCAVWIVVLLLLNRQYGVAFREVLSTRWIEPETPSEALRLPAARRALLEALRAEDEDRIVLALQLSGETRDPAIVRAVRECLGHPWPSVRAAAVSAMAAMRVPDRENRIAAFLEDPHEGLRRAAVGYLLLRGPKPVAFARRLLEGDDAALQGFVVDALFEHPCEARAALTLDWVDARIASGTRESLILAARALGAMTGSALTSRLRSLLTNPDGEVRAAALLSAIRRPARELLDALLPLLLEPDLHSAAREAVAAIGDPAVPALLRLLTPDQDHRAQSFAAGVLGRIGTHRASDALMTLVRSKDLRLRHLGLLGLARMRVRRGRPVLPRHTAHRLFLRELREYRECLDPATALETHPAPEVRLLADSYRESAEMALERALQALACWYDPQPLRGVFDRLKSREREVASPALEFLEHELPRGLFRPVRRIFEERPVPPAGQTAEGDPLVVWIEAAWKSEDGWLRACAVRASRFLPGFDAGSLAGSEGDPPMVRDELLARARQPC